MENTFRGLLSPSFFSIKVMGRAKGACKHSYTPQPQPTPTRSPKMSTMFTDLMAFGGAAPERINGRLAMIGFVTAIGVELANGQGLFEQSSNGQVGEQSISTIKVSSYKDDPRLPCDLALKKMVASSENLEDWSLRHRNRLLIIHLLRFSLVCHLKNMFEFCAFKFRNASL